jgi:hypothetical protein
VIEDKRRTLAFERLWVQLFGTITYFVRCLALHADENAAVSERVGETANLCQGLGHQQEYLFTAAGVAEDSAAVSSLTAAEGPARRRKAVFL